MLNNDAGGGIVIKKKSIKFLKIMMVMILTLLCTSCQQEEVSTIKYLDDDLDKANEIFNTELSSAYQYFSLFQLDTQDDFRKLQIQLYTNDGNQRKKLRETNIKMNTEKLYIYCQVKDNGEIVLGTRKENKTSGSTTHSEFYTLGYDQSWDMIYDQVDTFEFHGNESFPLIAFRCGTVNMDDYEVKLSDYDQDIAQDLQTQSLFMVLTLKY